jgi:hypothetical protein
VCGVPADLDLAFLHGAELIQVCLCLHQLKFQTPGGTSATCGKAFT